LVHARYRVYLSGPHQSNVGWQGFQPSTNVDSVLWPLRECGQSKVHKNIPLFDRVEREPRCRAIAPFASSD
jgi:hypothetical protein